MVTLPRMVTIAAEVLALAVLSQDAGTPEPPVQRDPEVSESRHDSSPPLRDIPPAPQRPGKRIHEVKPLPRPRPAPDAGVPESKD